MPGWNLKEGRKYDGRVSEDDFWKVMNGFFMGKSSRTTTYKYCFFKCLLDNIFNADVLTGELSYCVIFDRFAEIYWNLVAKYELRQKPRKTFNISSAIERIINDYICENHISGNVSFESQSQKLRDDLTSKIRQECSKFVVGALYNDFDGKLYGFNKHLGVIFFHKDAIDFLKKFKNPLGKVNYFEWIKYLENANRDVSKYFIATKLDQSSKRINLSFYKNYLKSINTKSVCFYCGKELSDSQIDVDHFIPWSFVKDDKIWNMVISCKECNNLKRDYLPEKQQMFELIKRNQYILSNSISNSPNSASMSSEMAFYSKEKLEEMYETAEFNGYSKKWRSINGKTF